jgi:hypothetical protein
MSQKETQEKKVEGVKLTVETANAILKYLGSKPYAEVSGLVDAIQSSELILSEDEVVPVLKEAKE